MNIRDTAIGLYEPPFRFECGYIFDKNGKMVADQGGAEGYALRVRGWGRIGYLDNPEALQDEVGAWIAEILTAHWLDKYRCDAVHDVGDSGVKCSSGWHSDPVEDSCPKCGAYSTVHDGHEHD